MGKVERSGRSGRREGWREWKLNSSSRGKRRGRREGREGEDEGQGRLRQSESDLRRYEEEEEAEQAFSIEELEEERNWCIE